MTRPAPVTSETTWAALVQEARIANRDIRATATWTHDRIETYRNARDEARQKADQTGPKENAMNEEELRAERERGLIEQIAAEERELEESYEQDRARAAQAPDLDA
ncbi:hypothetical protein [Dactylosporangium darangshiense]|uniref:Uncharacterized protein n=1 Tax=Dactylosporangium darangshiense TaxID=579108 RepID=A0ABP8DHZ2_9ACTN